MQINNLGGARMPVTTSANSTSQTARTSFGTLIQSGAGAPAAGRVGIPGSSIVSTAISVNSGSIPGATFGAPYQQAMPTSHGVPGSGSNVLVAPHGQTPGTTSAGSEFNGELQSTLDQQNALKDLMKMSLQSFMSSTFSMGQNRPGIEALEDD
jgi:hypothetical protein